MIQLVFINKSAIFHLEIVSTLIFRYSIATNCLMPRSWMFLKMKTKIC